MRHVCSTGISAARAALAAASTLILAASCGSGKPSSSGAPSASATAVASAAKSAPAVPSCAPGSHAVPDGGCVADEDAAAAEEPAPSASASAHPPAGCPTIGNPNRVVAYDWVKELGVDAPLAVRLRGVSGTAVEAQLFAAQIEAELRIACTGLAADLGTKGAHASAPVACQAAVDALHAARAKLGPAAKVGVKVHPAICPVQVDAVKECAKRCNGEDAAPEVTCAGAPVGKCPGTCDGACEVRLPGPCEGTCLGRCESGFSGTCDGTCKGKCNGKDLKTAGACKGTCDGACDAVGKGTCKGRCAGGCQLHASACAAVCTGKCSVPLEDVKCTGALKLASTGPECASYCELRVARRAVCGAAVVDVRVDGAKDTKAATAYANAIERYLPAILKVEAELKERAATLAKAKTTVADGLKAITSSGSPALGTLSPCLFGYDKAAAAGTDGALAGLRAASEAVAAARAK